jgi:hypothetical protein
MALNTGKKITCQSRDVFPMPDMVIAHVNALGTNQTEQLFFTNLHAHPIRDVKLSGVMDFEEDNDDVEMPILGPVAISDVELPGVDVAGQAPQTVEIDDLKNSAT